MRKFKTYMVLILLAGMMPCMSYSQGSTANLFYNNGDTVYVQSGGILHVQGDIANVSGVSSVFINDGLLNLEGDLTNNGIFKTDVSVGEGTVRLVGNSIMAGSATTGVQTLSGNLSTIGTGSFYNLVIDRGTSGQVVALGSNATVTGSLVWNGSSTAASTYTPSGYPATLGNSIVMQVRGTTPSGAGIIQTSSNQVYTSNNAANAVAGYTPSAYINGYLERAVTASSSYDLPVGSSSYYERANITFSSGLTGIHNLTANFNTGATTQPDPGTCIINGTKINALLNGGFWTIHPDVQPTGGTYTATLSMRGYTNAPSAGTTPSGGTVTPAQQLGLVKRANSSSSWLGCGVTVSGNPSTDQGTGSATDNATISGGVATVIRTGIPKYFSDFGIGIEQNNTLPLPVKLEYFAAEKNGDYSSQLNWATASETDNDYFDIERSADAMSWESLGQVKGAGNTIQEQLYSYIDASPVYGVNYYRLKQVDVDGNFAYTNIEQATFDGVSSQVMIMYPNPLAPSEPLTIRLSNSASAISNVSISNTMGQIVFSGGYSQSYVIQLNSLNLAAGVYAVSVSSEGAKPIISVLVVK